MTTEDDRNLVQEGYAKEEKAMTSDGQPIKWPTAPKKPTDSATSARPAEKKP